MLTISVSSRYQIGMDETCHRCRNLVVDALKQAGIDPDTKLVGLGLSLSGCEVAETMEQLRLRYPPRLYIAI